MENSGLNSGKELGKILLEVGALLMTSGANSMRIRVTVLRIANAYGYTADLLITHRALMLSLSAEGNDYFHSSLKRTLAHGSNFRMVSGISRMSWRIVEEDWSYQQIWDEIERLKALPHYPRIVVLSTVALAGASFCRLAGGGAVEMLVVFVATFIGLFVKQEAAKRKFNGYLCVFVASFVACLIAGAFVKYHVGSNPEFALATCVLYLIPGIPLINSLSDLLNGNIMNGIVRGTNGLIISFAIAFGMLCSILIYNI
ncbi:Uncharacterized membrane protein YjjP, DUF1212 family [Mariniphaga anaerophila]|uniref:Uncharacterized membrane protein YjjP, DUF1212 family n=1 Tax=Mariniphaga anaerophila TaxID=1484053 RepID=A0A1M5AR52_9BACT|nr:threonine/serine exporter family protein [Mariniphaga anaerophila]SHF32738.1 Uncharacterized membrane protein YjjP, DUF1212 family [Mariniphaga anaerophila]